MSQAGYTPISLYYSTTAAAVPTSGNLVAGELAINTLDGKLYYKNSAGTVTLLASSTTVTNSFSAGTTGLTPNTATTGAVTLAGTLVVGNGGTGQTTLATGALGYGQGASAHASLAIGTAGQILTSTGTAPQWSTLSGVAVTTFSAGTTGFTPSSATSGAVTLAGTLATTNGGTGLTSFTSGGVVYASSSSVLATGSALTFDGTTFKQTATTGTNAVYQTFNNTGGDFYIGRDNSTGTTFGTSAAYASVFYASGASPMVFFTNATEGLRLTSSSLYTASAISVGIGTSSPAATLTVSHASGVDGRGIRLVNSSNAQTWETRIGVQGLENTAYAIKDITASTLPLLIQAGTGNVGIGRTSPAYLIDAFDFTQGATTIRLLNSYGLGTSDLYGYSRLQGLSGGNGLFLSQNVNGINGASSVLDNSNTAGYAISMGENYSGWAFLKYAAVAGTVTPSVPMFLSSSGNLGIGITNPTIPLQVIRNSQTVLAAFGSAGTNATGQIVPIVNTLSIGRSYINVPASTTTNLVYGYGGNMVLISLQAASGVDDIQYTIVVTSGWNSATVLFSNTYGSNQATFTFSASGGTLQVNHNHSGAVNMTVHALTGGGPA